MVYFTVKKSGHFFKKFKMSKKIRNIINNKVYKDLKFNTSYSKNFFKIFQIPENFRHSMLTQIREIIPENSEVKTFLFYFPEIAKCALPGNFVMVNVFQKFKYDKFKFQPDEIPISLSHISPNEGVIGITVKKVGEGTKALHRHKVGDYVGIRGPYGQGFQVEKMGEYIVIIGGGIGIAPLLPLAAQLKATKKKFKILIGAKNQEELILTEKIKEIDPEFLITTEDGSKGFKGQVTELLEELVKVEPITDLAVCGPEKMIKKCIEIAKVNEISLQASLERYIKCGRGICGHCSIDGLLVCKDGPVFSLEVLDKLEGIGKYKKDACGRRIPLI